MTRHSHDHLSSSAPPAPTKAAMLDTDRLRRLFDSGIVGVVSWDITGAIDDANDEFLDIFGYTREDLETGRLDWDVLQPAESMPLRAATGTRALERGTAGPIDSEYRRKDGTPVFVRLRSTGVDDDPTKVLSVVVDISAQKRAEAQRDALLACERRARAEAEAAVRAREEILAIVSHDLRNPLNSISLSATVLESALHDAKVTPQVGIIIRAVARMSRLIQDLLDVSRITSGRLEVNPTPIELATLFEDVRMLLQPQLLQKDQHFECETPEAPAVVAVDPHRVAQVLANLVGNATKFTPEGGRIRLGARRVDGEMLVSVSDTGQGIDAQDLPNIFDRFWQAPRVRRGGVGLGLRIAKGIVDAHGGRLWAESSPGVGTTFFFTLPLSQPCPVSRASGVALQTS